MDGEHFLVFENRCPSWRTIYLTWRVSAPAAMYIKGVVAGSGVAVVIIGLIPLGIGTIGASWRLIARETREIRGVE